MPLIECPDCHRQISDAAPACPACGRPMKVAPAPLAFGAPGTGVLPTTGPMPVQTVELTSKKWKVQQLASGALFIIGCVVSVVGFRIYNTPQEGGYGPSGVILKSDTSSPALLYVGLAIAGAGLAWAVVVQLMVWWHHR